ncbi:MAG TPA: hypothetical protein VGA49_02010 [Patescibacteria group bacterium]
MWADDDEDDDWMDDDLNGETEETYSGLSVFSSDYWEAVHQERERDKKTDKDFRLYVWLVLFIIMLFGCLVVSVLANLGLIKPRLVYVILLGLGIGLALRLTGIFREQ